jgi:hypothetical protein
MNIDTSRVRDCLKSFDFRNLFVEELGWNICDNRPVDVQIGTQTFCLTPFAEQGGMVIYLGESLADGTIPPSNIRRVIETRITKLTHEHMIIFVNKEQTRSVWQWIRRQQGKQTAAREHTYYKGQPGDSLLQKLADIAFSIDDLDEEGRIAIAEVTGRVIKAFDVEKVTRRFYDEFEKEHSNFSKFLTGMEGQDELSWYTSVMLDRLMFIYFIQKKGFLDGDIDYLANKLRESKVRGANQFYRRFLIKLFFDGFAKENAERSQEVNQLLGKVPYLNGGLFLPHQLELAHGENINITDAAFERLFAFFDRYSWHLDYRPLRADNEINPDILGYIFEKYVNQKQMGAYYTKEDITDYICKNTIIPFLFDKLEGMRYDELHPFPMKDVEPYIYDAVKQENYLPTETEREYQARQKRYQQIKKDFTAGKIANINDLITYNLNIRKFAEDWTRGIKGPVTLRAFYFHCLTKVTVLDPAVGSGAFLFAAMNMLEPLYEVCLDKMAELGGPKYPDFAEELARICQHPNRKYFVLKSIIVNNLFGVDIMEEAVEICKLRLFLKLVSQVDDVDKIEPLPDIDFNIRAGNSLVGYVNEEEIKRAKATQLDLSGALKGIEDRIENVDRALKVFRDLQTRLGIPASELAKAKAEVKDKLAEIQGELDKDLAAFYGAPNINHFVQIHQPFHWLVEFYSIMKSGGFDAIIGNPPYVEYNKVRQGYTIQGYETESCGNTYAFFTERSTALLRKSGRFGMIVQLPIVCTDRMKPLQKLCLKRSSLAWFANFDDRPARLFDGLEHIRACIFTLRRDGGNSQSCTVFTTTYNRWYTEDRPNLFQLLSFIESTRHVMDGAIPKMGEPLAKSIRQRIDTFSPLSKFLRQRAGHTVYFHNSPQYWIRTMTFVPYFWNERDGEQISTQVKPLYLTTKLEASVVAAILNSSLFYWWFILLSDCRHLNLREIEALPLGLEKMTAASKQKLAGLAQKLMADLKAHSQRKEAYYKTTGQVIYDEFSPKYSKPIIDEIDRVLAKHYGFTEEELDFIINYDIKYRTGKNEEEDNNNGE